MFKKLCFALMLIVTFSLFSLPAFAAGSSPVTSEVYSTDTGITGNYYITITNPEKTKDSTYKKSYTISGTAKVDNVKILILKYDSDSDKYVKFEDVDGDSVWDIGSAGPFQREIKLDKSDNKIRLIAYLSTSDKGDKVQIYDFTITRWDKSIFDGIFNGAINFFKGIF
ncbi:MAG: hypothetical protein Q8920_17095 [Bacillota bacterium]|nr:hypothetical protein [Bacillota bacterium]